jgi:hypothetical protein
MKMSNYDSNMEAFNNAKGCKPNSDVIFIGFYDDVTELPTGYKTVIIDHRNENVWKLIGDLEYTRVPTIEEAMKLEGIVKKGITNGKE